MAKMTAKTPFGKAVRILLSLFVLGILAFALMLLMLTYAEKHVPAPKGEYDAVIVLGAQVKPDGEPSVQLRLRLEKALEQYRRSPCLIVACGAQGENEPAPEGDVMKQWLVSNGVPEDHIISETQSFNTWQNIRNAKNLLPDTALRVVVVTSDYHLPRALQICRDEGLEADGAGSPIMPLWWFKNHAREVLAWCKYFVGKVLPINK
ncbi:MAG: YdcF family protein [Clostridiales bacterium]|nr:YdcF family protein [Clostridiales bacterium]